MLSVLIPTYNYNIFPLVEEIHSLLKRENIIFEIICLDDGSKNTDLNSENNKINSYEHASFSELPKNIGRSSIRNLLAKRASYEWLLFLDADVFPKQKNFISEYLKYMNSDFEVIYGGILYQEEKPDAAEMLRWKYGHAREAIAAEIRMKNPYISFLTMNFLIRKNVFNTVNFNEQIKDYGHEDTLFSYNLKQQKIKLQHIHNPVYHIGLESSENFLKKSLESVKGAYFLEKEGLIASEYIKILQFYKKMQRLKLLPPILNFGKMIQPQLEKNLLSSNPNLKLFDFYRLIHLYKLKNA